MPPRRRNHVPGVVNARTWDSLLEFDEIALDVIYDKILANLANARYHEERDLAEQQGIPFDVEAPDISDPTELYRAVLAGQIPAWWPKQLDRVEIKVRIQPDDAPPHNYGPSTFDPNTRDLGKQSFIMLCKNLCESIGTPFTGNINLQVARKKDKAWLGGYRGEVSVGALARGRGGERNEEWDAITEHALKQADKKDEAMLRMFGQASSVITASAAALNAARGVNMGPPWMQEGEGESPFWQSMASEVMKIVGGAMFGGTPALPGAAAGAANTMLQHPVPNNPRALQYAGARPALPMHPEGDLGYDQYMEDEEGDYEGFYADDGDLLEDDFGYEEDDSYDDYDEEESSAPGNPLKGMSPHDVQQFLNEWLDEGHDKNQIKQLGMSLLPKVMN